MTETVPKIDFSKIGDKDLVQAIDRHCLALQSETASPLLVMFYPEDLGSIEEEDVEEVFDELDRHDINAENRTERLDVLLHTFGGHPDSAYQLAQIIRDAAERVRFLVPFYAFSGGTLLCLAGDSVLLGPFAKLSPVDITVVEESPDGEIRDMQLLSIDSFIRFASHAKEEMTREGAESSVEDSLLTEMVEQVGALEIGELFRTRELTASYAKVLLKEYMLRGLPEDARSEMADEIVNELVFESPTHDFFIDFHIARDMGVVVDRMPIGLFRACRPIVESLREATQRNLICRYLGPTEGNPLGYRQPFFRLYLGE